MTREHGLIAGAIALAWMHVQREQAPRRAAYAALAQLKRNDAAHIAAAAAKRKRRAEKARAVADKREGGE